MIRSVNSGMLDALSGLVAIPSISQKGDPSYPYGQGPAQALDYVLDLCKSLGFRVKNADHIYGYAEIGEGTELIGILGHLDVVPAGDGWDTDPFEATIVGDRIYGRGVSDDKGPTIAAIFAMKELLESGRTLNKRIRIIFGQSEETGDWDDIQCYCQNEDIPDYGFVPDSVFPVVCGEKGIGIMTVSMPLKMSGFSSISGGQASNMVPDKCVAQIALPDGSIRAMEASGISAHGSTPWEGSNAIAALMEQVEAEYGQNVPLACIYNTLIGRCFHGTHMGCAFEDEQSGKLSMNVGRIESSADTVTLYIDTRIPVTYTAQDVFEAMKTTFSRYGMHTELLYGAKPLYLEKNGPIIKALLCAYEHVMGEVAEPVILGGGTYAKAMERFAAFGPFFPGHSNTEHQANEYYLLEDLINTKEIYRTALENLLEI